MSSKLKVIEDREVLQRADRHGPAIGRVQIILNEGTGERTEVRYWYENGRLSHVDSLSAGGAR